ncbi:MAG TPA: 4-aminobutyrate--2-oxoglutarate transaminase [Thermodesulfobacteriota bacterium]|nr:4-aminobutyrate--2-oxoglutarate transaminase [Thermodesulfobacteriota bacterium]
MVEKNKSDYLSELRKNVIPPGYKSATQIYVESAKGVVIRDIEGKEYLDFAGGIGVMNVGHSHPKVVAAIKDQAEKFTHTCFMVVPYESAIKLGEKLCKIAPGTTLKSTLFVNSGSEAVENAVKIARYYTKRQAIIALEHGYHGRTQLAMTLTSKVNPFKLGFGPFAPEVYHIPAPYCYRCSFGLKYPGCGVACAENLADFLKNRVGGECTAAVIAEPILGEGGFITPPPEYFTKLTSICKANGVVFIADEIQSGTGRTGKMFAIEHFGIEPDIITLAKSFAGGMPLSAVIGKREIMNSVHPGGLGGTYSANPIACSAALAVLDIFAEENLLQKAEVLGKKMRERLVAFQKKFEIIGEVRGLGPMLAIELVKDQQTKMPAAEETSAVQKYCVDHGVVILVCGTYNNVIRFLPPLCITDQELNKGLSIVEEGLASLQNKRSRL